MKSCRNCRTKFDPTFTLHCPECGASIDPSVDSMTVPTPEPASSSRPSDAAAESAGPAGEALRRSGVGVGGRFVRRLGIRLVIALIAIGVGGVVSYFDDRPSDDPTAVTFESVSAGDFALGDPVGASDLAVGDCVNWPPDDAETFETLERLDCGLPHDAEVFALVDHPAASDADYPGNDSVAEWGVQACYEQWTPYVGRTYEDVPDLDYTFFTPTELGWAKYDDRAIQCLIFNIDETTLLSSVRAGA